MTSVSLQSCIDASITARFAINEFSGAGWGRNSSRLHIAPYADPQRILLSDSLQHFGMFLRDTQKGFRNATW